MTFKEVALHMWPSWLIGLTILAMTFKSKYRPLLKINFKAIKIFMGLLVFMMISRLICWKLFHRMTILPVDMKAVQEIPWQAVLFVFWEDATFILPLMIFKRIVAGKKHMKLFYYATMFLMCLDFGSGHLYQSIWVGLFMMAYIPMVMDLAEQYGMGTVMVGHTLFDLTAAATTFLAMRGQ